MAVALLSHLFSDVVLLWAAEGPVRPPSVEERAELDRKMLADVRDGTESIEGPALYLLLQKAAKRPIQEDAPSEAETVTAETLLRHPETYRGTLVRLEAMAWEAGVWDRPDVSGKWPVPFYFVLCTSRPGGEPVWLITVEDPGQVRSGRYVVVEGFFYKIRRSPSRGPVGPEEERIEVSAPVIVGKRAEWPAIARTGANEERISPLTFIPLALVILLCVGWLLVRRRASGGAEAAAPQRRGAAEAPSRAHGTAEEEWKPPTEDAAEALELLQAHRLEHKPPASKAADE